MQQHVRSGSTPGSLCWSLVSGFLAWGLDLAVNYASQHAACSSGRTFVHDVIALACIAIALSGSLAGIALYRRLPRDTSEEGGRPVDRAHFQALLGLAFNAAFALAIVAADLPRWILRRCN
jgi:hypothetical protein